MFPVTIGIDYMVSALRTVEGLSNKTYFSTTFGALAILVIAKRLNYEYDIIKYTEGL